MIAGLFLLALGGVLVIAVACKPAPALPAANGTALLNYITRENDYTKWKMWPGRDALYVGKSEPHGAFLTTYVTDTAFSAIEGKKGSIPYGSIIVKENYTPDKKLAAVTVMYKVKGFDPEHKDWFWLEYFPDGKIEFSGKVDMCNSCHGARKENDYIFTSDLKVTK
ncbi:MAG: cytochrome P460 family protein [Chloroflexi bacterium]|nr:cytochrome P460 family protein [Chloroflexota bacterium]